MIGTFFAHVRFDCTHTVTLCFSFTILPFWALGINLRSKISPVVQSSNPCPVVQSTVYTLPRTAATFTALQFTQEQLVEYHARGNQLLRHSWKTPSTVLLWRLHTALLLSMQSAIACKICDLSVVQSACMRVIIPGRGAGAVGSNRSRAC